MQNGQNRDRTEAGMNRPRYFVVAQCLIDGILSGQFPVGSHLPTEHSLCKQFTISRHTAREALRRLEAEGLITRRAGIGTIVRASRIRPRYMQVGDTVSDLYQYAQDISLHLLEAKDIHATGDVAARLGCAKGQPWLQLHGLRKIAGNPVPVALTDIFVSGAYREVQADVAGSVLPVWSLIEARFGVTPAEVHQEITATGLNAQEAAKLGAKKGDAALRITRHYQSEDNETYEVAINLYPADRFSYSNTLRLKTPTLT